MRVKFVAFLIDKISCLLYICNDQSMTIKLSQNCTQNRQQEMSLSNPWELGLGSLWSVRRILFFYPAFAASDRFSFYEFFTSSIYISDARFQTNCKILTLI